MCIYMYHLTTMLPYIKITNTSQKHSYHFIIIYLHCINIYELYIIKEINQEEVVYFSAKTYYFTFKKAYNV